MELKKERTQILNLSVLVGDEVTTYAVQVLFTLGTKQGETQHQKWSFTTITENIENANLELNYFNAEGYEARIVKITTKAEVIEWN